MKKGYVLLAAIVMGTNLMACAVPAAPAAPAAAPAQTGEEEKVEEVGTESTGKIVIDFQSHVGNPESQAPQLVAAAKAYMEQHPDVDIQITGNSDLKTKIQLAAQSDTLPDIWWGLVDASKELRDEGMLADLSDILSQDTEYVSHFLPGAYGGNISDDSGIYGLSCEMQTNCFWINTKLYEDCGVELPTTIEDIIESAPVFVENGITPWVIGTSANLGLTWGPVDALWYYDIGTDFEALASGEMDWNNDKMVAYFKNFENAAKAGVFPEDSETLDYFKARELFVNGDAAIFCSGIWDIPAMEGSEYADSIKFWWGPTYETANVKEAYQFMSAGYPYCVSGKMKEEDPAKYEAVCDFFKFFFGAEGAQISVDNNTIPTTDYATEFDAASHPVFSQAYEACVAADNVAPMNMEMLIGSARTNAFCQTLMGVINNLFTAEEAAERLATEMAILE